MTNEAAEFQQFLQVWTDERIVALGRRDIEHGSRETMLKGRADELRGLAKKRGFLSQLSARAKQHGDVRGYVSALYRAAEDGPSLDPTPDETCSATTSFAHGSDVR
jgi:hypothetical protein